MREIITILMNKAMDFTKIYKKYSGLWVVLDRKLKKVIASNRDAKRAYSEALDKGFESPTLFKVPRENLPYIGFYSFKR